MRVREIDRDLATGKVEGGRQWYVNGQGQTLVVVPPGEFEWEPFVFQKREGERLRVRIERRFALAAREVMLEEFLRFRPDHPYSKENTLTGGGPVNVSLFEAAAYCNWLSEREGIAKDQCCYLPNEKGLYADGMKLAAGWQNRSGYRLPTDAEWEYACRAGSVTSWSMGDAEDLLGKYAWYAANNSSTLPHPVGTLRPNDTGLFDMHGNLGEWCQDKFLQQKVAENEMKKQDDLEVIRGDGKTMFSVKGGAFNLPALYAMSGMRMPAPPMQRTPIFGFRPARTIR
jgi:formylglycine-generating enzyme required for sulfatase activity